MLYIKLVSIDRAALTVRIFYLKNDCNLNETQPTNLDIFIITI